MNLLLLDQFVNRNDIVTISGYQFEHLKKVLKVGVGDPIRIGVINGNIGQARIVQCNEVNFVLQIIHLDIPSPPNLPVTIILALPRPQMIKRIFQTVAMLGVSKLCLIQTGRVEKSFWQSPALSEHEVNRQLVLGLEQAVATQLPVVEYYRRFIPFIEDTLDQLCGSSTKLIAHPGGDDSVKQLPLGQRVTVAVGPEGGFTENEVALFQQAEFAPIHFGQRILKVETAIPYLLAKLF